MRNYLLGFTALVSLWPVVAAAQTETVMVVADRLEESLPQDISQTGSRLTIIDSTTIENRSYTDTQQALQFEVPGLSIVPFEGPFGYALISLQGSRPSDVLYAIDGIRINNRLYQNTTPFDTIPAHMIDHVEVLEGGQALFYGTQAIAGVINIVTKPFSTGPRGQFSVGLDTNTSHSVSGYYSNSIGGLRFVVYGSQDGSEGYQPYRDKDYQPSATDRNRSYDVQTYGGKIAYDFTNDVRFSGGWQHTDAELDISRAVRLADSFNEKDEDLISGKLDWRVNNSLDLFIKGYYHDWDVEVTEFANPRTGPVGPGGLINNGVKVPWGFWDYGFNSLARLQTGRGVDLYGGWDMQSYYGKDEFYNTAAQSEVVHALFGQFRTTDDLVQDLTFAAGFRHNIPSQAPSTTIWNVSGQYDFMGNLFVKGTVGTGFRLPTAGELFVDYHEPGYNEIGNPNLRPETSFNVNGSIGGTVGDMFRWEVVGFYRTISDLIDYEEIAPDTYSTFNSNAEVRFKGFEVIGSAALGMGVMASGSFTYTQARAAGSNTQLQRIPETHAQASLDWAPMDRPYGFAITVSYTGEAHYTQNSTDVQYGKYAVVDLSGRYYLDADRKHRFRFRLQNVFDTVYGQPRSQQYDAVSTGNFVALQLAPPRTFHMGYDYSF